MIIGRFVAGYTNFDIVGNFLTPMSVARGKINIFKKILKV